MTDNDSSTVNPTRLTIRGTLSRELTHPNGRTVVSAWVWRRYCRYPRGRSPTPWASFPWNTFLTESQSSSPPSEYLIHPGRSGLPKKFRLSASLFARVNSRSFSTLDGCSRNGAASVVTTFRSCVRERLQPIRMELKLKSSGTAVQETEELPLKGPAPTSFETTNACASARPRYGNLRSSRDRFRLQRLVHVLTHIDKRVVA